MALERDRRIRRAPPPAPLRIDQGIEKILRAPVRPADERATVSGHVSPAYTATRQRLDELYAMPNLDDYLVGTSWDSTWERMWRHIEAAIAARAPSADVSQEAGAAH